MADQNPQAESGEALKACPAEIVRKWFAERQYGKRIQKHTAQELLDRLKAARVADPAPDDESDKPPMPAHDYAAQWASDTLSGKATGGRFPWGDRNLARCYRARNQDLDEARTEIEARDALLKQMAEALKRIALGQVSCPAEAQQVAELAYSAYRLHLEVGSVTV